MRDGESCLRALMTSVDPRPPALKPICRSVFACLSAGASPNSIPTKIETPSANRRTEVFTPMFSMRGRFPGTAARVALSPNLATASPGTPPVNDRRTLSVINCRMICIRLAPSDRRTANSRVRAPERPSNRSVSPTSPTRLGFDGTIDVPAPFSVVGLSSLICS